jgi:hypothetical protein
MGPRSHSSAHAYIILVHTRLRLSAILYETLTVERLFFPVVPPCPA